MLACRADRADRATAGRPLRRRGGAASPPSGTERRRHHRVLREDVDQEPPCVPARHVTAGGRVTRQLQQPGRAWPARSTNTLRTAPGCSSPRWAPTVRVRSPSSADGAVPTSRSSPRSVPFTSSGSGPRTWCSGRRQRSSSSPRSSSSRSTTPVSLRLPRTAERTGKRVVRCSAVDRSVDVCVVARLGRWLALGLRGGRDDRRAGRSPAGRAAGQSGLRSRVGTRARRRSDGALGEDHRAARGRPPPARRAQLLWRDGARRHLQLQPGRGLGRPRGTRRERGRQRGPSGSSGRRGDARHGRARQAPVRRELQVRKPRSPQSPTTW